MRSSQRIGNRLHSVLINCRIIFPSALDPLLLHALKNAKESWYSTNVFSMENQVEVMDNPLPQKSEYKLWREQNVAMVCMAMQLAVQVRAEM